MGTTRDPTPLGGDAYRIYPPPSRRLEPSEIHADLVLPDGTRSGRPYVVINAVSTLDGRAALDGTSSKVGSALDRLVMRNIRCAVDAVLVGAGTLRAENLDLGVPRELTQRRTRNNLTPQPLHIILKGTTPLPEERRIYYSRIGEHGEQRDGNGAELLIIGVGGSGGRTMPEGASFRELPSRGTDGRPDPGEVLRLLREEFGVRRLLVEGGPRVNHAFLRDGLVAEIFLTLAPKLSGSPDAPSIAGDAGALPGETRAARLLTVHAATGGELYLRYRL